MTAAVLKPGALEGRVAPRPDAGEHARTTEDELGALVAFLASAGGEYFSGCRFELR